MKKALLFVFLILQIPFLQKQLLMSGNYFLPNHYQYNLQNVYGVFPLYFKCAKLKVTKENKLLAQSQNIKINLLDIWKGKIKNISIETLEIIKTEQKSKKIEGPDVDWINYIYYCPYIKNISIDNFKIKRKTFRLNFKTEQNDFSLKALPNKETNLDYIHISGKIKKNSIAGNIFIDKKEFNIKVHYNYHDKKIDFKTDVHKLAEKKFSLEGEAKVKNIIEINNGVFKSDKIKSSFSLLVKPIIDKWEILLKTKNLNCNAILIPGNLIKMSSVIKTQDLPDLELTLSEHPSTLDISLTTKDKKSYAKLIFDLKNNFLSGLLNISASNFKKNKIKGNNLTATGTITTIQKKFYFNLEGELETLSFYKNKAHNISVNLWGNENDLGETNINIEKIKNLLLEIDDSKIHINKTENVNFKSSDLNFEITHKNQQLFLTHLQLKSHIKLKAKTLIFPLIENLELEKHDKKTILKLEKFEYKPLKFKTLFADLPVKSKKIKFNLNANLTNEEHFKGIMQIKNIKSPYINKTLNFNLTAEKNLLEVVLKDKHKKIMHGQIKRSDQENINGYLLLDIDINDWNPYQIISSDIMGSIKGKILIGGSIHSPELDGVVRISEGYYENIELGVLIQNINGIIKFNKEIITANIQTKDPKNKESRAIYTSITNINKKESKHKIDLKNFQIIENDSSHLNVSGNIECDAWNIFKVRGSISINKAFISLDSSHQEDEKYILVNCPMKIEKEEKRNLDNLDIDIKVNRKLTIAGKGLSAKWDGSLKIKNNSEDIYIIGRLDALKGSLSLLGKEMSVAKGHIIFDEKKILDPKISLVFTKNIENIEITVLLVGRAKSLRTPVFSSTPALPMEDIISYILFSTKRSNLSVYQVARLAYAVTLLNQNQANRGFTKLSNTIDIKNVQNFHDEDNPEQAISIGQEIGSTKFSLEKEISNKTIRANIEQKISPNLKAIFSIINKNEKNDTTNSFASELGLRYIKNY